MIEEGEPDGSGPSTAGEPSPAPVAAEPAAAYAQPAPEPGEPHVQAESVTSGAQPKTAPVGGNPWARYTARRRRKKAEKVTRPHRKAPWWELPGLVILAILIAILVKTFIIQPFYIPSESMEKTLHGCKGCHGDRILVNKLIYDFRDPHPGDIVVFHAPPGWNDEPTSKPPSNPFLKGIRGFGQLVGVVPPDGQVLVKRVIATGGQTVEGDSEGDVRVSNHGPNGPFRTLNEPYVYIAPGESPTMRVFGPVTVPKGRLWVMGDHRSDSADSRYHCGPNGTDSNDDTNCNPISSTVPVSDVIGKAFVIAWPPSRWRTLGTPKTFESALGAPITPSAVSAVAVLPVFLVRRRRRRRR